MSNSFTTIAIDKEIHYKAKLHATKEKLTLKELIENLILEEISGKK